MYTWRIHVYKACTHDVFSLAGQQIVSMLAFKYWNTSCCFNIAHVDMRQDLSRKKTFKKKTFKKLKKKNSRRFIERDLSIYLYTYIEAIGYIDYRVFRHTFLRLASVFKIHVFKQSISSSTNCTVLWSITFSERIYTWLLD